MVALTHSIDELSTVPPYRCREHIAQLFAFEPGPGILTRICYDGTTFSAILMVGPAVRGRRQPPAIGPETGRMRSRTVARPCVAWSAHFHRVLRSIH